MRKRQLPLIINKHKLKNSKRILKSLFKTLKCSNNSVEGTFGSNNQNKDKTWWGSKNAKKKYQHLCQLKSIKCSLKEIDSLVSLALNSKKMVKW